MPGIVLTCQAKSESATPNCGLKENKAVRQGFLATTLFNKARTVQRSSWLNVSKALGRGRGQSKSRLGFANKRQV
ncbi:MAG: hypothetical protein DME65_07160 [Verrucomicrobia bacterium]|nr:MAG: hypothetical protein DME65_07160 [Verrucomicrobiota bacterium]